LYCWKTGSYQVVYSFGWYLRKFIMDVKEKGAVPIVLSHTQINRNLKTHHLFPHHKNFNLLLNL
jgi:hypothetical protein